MLCHDDGRDHAGGLPGRHLPKHALSAGDGAPSFLEGAFLYHGGTGKKLVYSQRIGALIVEGSWVVPGPQPCLAFLVILPQPCSCSLQLA